MKAVQQKMADLVQTQEEHSNDTTISECYSTRVTKK